MEQQVLSKKPRTEDLERMRRLEERKLRQAKAAISKVQEGFEAGIYDAVEAKQRIARLRETIVKAEAEIRGAQLGYDDEKGGADPEKIREHLRTLRDCNLDEATFEERLHLMSKQYTFGCGAEEDAPPRLVRLGLKSDANSRHGVHRFGQTLGESIAHRGKVDTHGVFVAVDPRPNDRKISVEFTVQLKRLLGALDRRLTMLCDRIGKRSPFELLIPKQKRNDGDELDAGVGGERFPQVGDVAFTGCTTH